MIIDLSGFEETENVREVSRKVSLDNFEFRHQEIEIPEPINLDLDIYNTGDSFVFTGSLQGNIRLECSRCLEPFALTIDIELKTEIEKSEIDNLEQVDLTPVIKENILLAIPIKPLCSEDCQGLCPRCGQNLNKGQCDCDPESVDPRLAKLKNFFAE